MSSQPASTDPGYDISQLPVASLSAEQAREAFPELFDNMNDEEVAQLVLSAMITVESTVAADNTDFLAGTQLDQPGVSGVYTIWAASTVGDTLLSITLGGRTITNNAVVTLRANSEIRENEDTFFQMLAVGPGRPVININVVTAAVVRVRVKFLPAAAV